jgi:hypothetical protein
MEGTVKAETSCHDHSLIAFQDGSPSDAKICAKINNRAEPKEAQEGYGEG